MTAASALLMTRADRGPGCTVQSVYVCLNCHRLNVATEHNPDGYVTEPSFGSRENADSYDWGPYVQWLPKRGERKDFPDVPDHIAEAASEATYCLSMGANRAAGSLARAVVEATAKDKKAQGGNLAARIDALAAAGHLREFTKEQAHEIRHFGNGMAHGDFTDPVSDEAAAEIVELMGAVLDEVYQAPARLAKVRAARQAKREANGGS